jgi:acyl-CoA synthetase (AMP-forming)/AMP-acid ligase II
VSRTPVLPRDPAAPPADRADHATRFWEDLDRYGDRPALITADGSLTYADLAARVRSTADRLGPTRRLVLLAGANDVDSIVGYLAALAGGHPVILLPGDHPGNLAAVADAYDPDVLLDGGRIDERRPGTRHELHPDLAVMLSTSGSTGSPKLVRLSHDNLAANAGAIASYLGIRSTDVAATTLPMHYCYGLSVINSHLAAGAALFLTELSVVDPCFWDAVRTHRVSTLAGVPYTFDLLDRVGFATMELPSLRYVTQAGGRLGPDRVRRYAELGRERGWDLFVMYGQTEATARMGYLPPDLATESPSAIGVPIPGGSFRLEPLPEVPLDRAAPREEQVGELVYSGANVMLGYAAEPADLARGRDVDELRTGDVARRTPEGLYEIIGRRSRFAKLFGLRIDLDQVERVFADEGYLVHCADAGERLVVAVDVSARPVDPAELHAVAKAHFGLPPRAVQVLPLTEVPRLPSGKPDYRSIVARADSYSAELSPVAPAPAGVEAATTPRYNEIRAAFADVLGRDDISEDDTFVSLGGDSLSYVEMSIRLEGLLGTLPAGWHLIPISRLAGVEAPQTPQRGRSVETNVLLRALAIVMIVGTHANLLAAAGGAHVLLGVAGFNFGRFHMTDAPRRQRVRNLAASIARIVVPSVVWLGLVALFTGQHGWTNVLLLNAVLGPSDWSEPQWWYWFIEALVYTLVVLTALMAIPWVDGLERRWSFWLPMTLAVAGLLTRYDVLEPVGGDDIHRAHVVLWLFALGWATVKSTERWQRVLVSLVVVATVPGFFGQPVREAIVVAGMLLLVWVGAVRLPGWLTQVAGVLAASSLYIYLCHWQIYPHLEDSAPFLATVLALLGGIAFWMVATRVAPYVERGAVAAARALRAPDQLERRPPRSSARRFSTMSSR